jgi:hypothetical protein
VAWPPECDFLDHQVVTRVLTKRKRFKGKRNVSSFAQMVLKRLEIRASSKATEATPDSVWKAGEYRIDQRR